MYPDVFWYQWCLSNDNQVFPMLSDLYAHILTTPMTSKMHTYTSQPIVTSPSTYTLKCWQFPLICNDPLWLYVSHELLTSSMSPTFHSSISQPGDLDLSPMQPSVLCSVLFDILYSYPRSWFEIIPSHCLAHCLSIARYSFMYLIFIAYARFPSSCYISCSHSLTHHTHLTHHLTPTLSIKPVPSMPINNNCVPLFHTCLI
jgi:hypothetical protein